MKYIVGFIALIAMDIPVLILRGFVYSQLWLWFFVPFGLPELDIAWAIGIALFIGLMFTNVAKEKSELEDQNWFARGLSQLITSIFASLLFWGMGAIVHSFM